MPVDFACDCGRMLRVEDDLAGKAVRCPICRKIVNAVAVPTEAEPPMASIAPEVPAAAESAPQPAPRPGPLSRHGGVRPPPPPPGRTSRMAIVGLVISGGSFLFGRWVDSLEIMFCGGILGIGISLFAWARIHASGGKLRGGAIASSAAIVGAFSAGAVVLFLVLGIVLLLVIIVLIAQFLSLFPSGTSSCH